MSKLIFSSQLINCPEKLNSRNTSINTGHSIIKFIARSYIAKYR